MVTKHFVNGNSTMTFLDDHGISGGITSQTVIEVNNWENIPILTKTELIAVAEAEGLSLVD